MTIESTFTERERAAAATLIDLALREDLGDLGDLTCQALISPSERAAVNVVVRKPGVIAGSPVGRMVFSALDSSMVWTAHIADGERVSPGDVVATVAGPLARLLIGERTMLNFLTHLSGIATLARRFVDVVAGTRAVILDTRKTLPGYRVLEKYAVRCGGGTNHRMGLYDGVLIKDNHVAAWTSSAKPRDCNRSAPTIADAVCTARTRWPGVSIEVEVDSLDQLRDALQGEPDIVLLDNMDVATMREAVAIRNALRLSPPRAVGGRALQDPSDSDAASISPPGDSPGAKTPILLEASGGITLDNIRAIAETGVDRISIGALTHSAPALDLAFDWAPV